jgi:nucleotide-binding universal stress UspA family protein
VATWAALPRPRSSRASTTRPASCPTRSAHLQAAHLTGAAQLWHFQRRDGAIADQLIAVADDLRLKHGTEAAVVIIVGRPEHEYHHVLGSIPQALERHAHYPVIVIA